MATGRSKSWRTTMSITWTCARWRHLSINQASLWQKVDLETIPCSILKLFEERNTILPWSLSFNNDLYDPNDQIRRQFLVDHIHFTRKLAFFSSYPVSYLPATMEAPFLESLRVTIDTLPDGATTPIRFVNHPRLHKLSLSRQLYSSSPSAFCALRKLTINLEFWEPRGKTLSFFSILTACPDLEELALCELFIRRVFDDLPSDDLLNTLTLTPFQQLKKLRLGLSLRDVHLFLSLFKFSPDLVLNLEPFLEEVEEEEYNFSPLLPLDPRCLPSLKSTCELIIDPGNDICLTAHRIEYPSSSPTDAVVEHVPFLQVKTDDMDVPFRTQNIIELLRFLPSVQHLQIACWNTRQPLYTVNFAIATMLKMVPSLRHLHLSRCSQNTCKALSIWAQYTQLQALPCLHSLTIFQTDLRNCSADLVALCRNLSTHLKNIWLLECQVVSDYQGTRILQDLRNSGIPNVFLEPRVT